MTVQVISERDIMEEAARVLLENMTPAKAARFWAGWQAGRGDYLEWRDKTFDEETVETLYEKVVRFEREEGGAPGRR